MADSTTRGSRLWTGLMAVGMLATVGAAITWRSFAATWYASAEPEQSVASTAITTANDTAASGGQYITFGGSGAGAQCKDLDKSSGGTWVCSFDDEFSGSLPDVLRTEYHQVIIQISKELRIAKEYLGNGLPELALLAA